MASPIVVRAAGRTAVVSTWLAVLVVAGRPVWLAVLLGLVLVGVWAAPLLSATNRRPAPTRPETIVTVCRGPVAARIEASEGE
ncbi:hypothetical protein [Petropleomorpha daqingensis]|uniref:Uncharacterized protein n=1 Tax=Petropleomorpha daqingensis TaxID=2026353 RepID=A0A853CCH2_9ACTN|nr:hypothetical protein [Petropleomorpha daqingensis]NYJ05715.1 hypothetical protein [Petropleomorpha daqingensis]